MRCRRMDHRPASKAAGGRSELGDPIQLTFPSGVTAE